MDYQREREKEQRMNKRTILIVLALTLTLLSGCSEKQQKETEIAPATETSVAGISESGDEEIGTQEAQDGETDEQTTEAQIEESIGNLILGLPEDFVAYEGEEGLYVCKTYPREIACISFMVAEYDGEKDITDKVDYTEQLIKTFLDSYGEVVTVDVNDFWQYEVDGREVVEIESAYTLLGSAYEQLQLLIYDEEGKQQYNITYMQETGNKWMNAFRRSAESISFSN